MENNEILDRLSDDLETIREIGTISGKPGVNRVGYTSQESGAHEFVKAEMERLGLCVRTDTVGNLYAVFAGKSQQKIAFGSHLDSVPNGGNYDGGLGVVMGLEAMRQLRDVKLNHSLELVVWRCEESSRFGSGLVGSKLATGYSGPDLLNLKDGEGITLNEAIAHAGFGCEPSKPLKAEDYAAYVEPHIEQSDQLVKLGQSVGIVTGIRAPVRYEVTVLGQWNHSGALEMRYRKDALVAASRMIVSVYEHALEYEKNGARTVATVGKLGVPEGAINRVPGEAEFLLDIRGMNVEQRDKLEADILEDLRYHSRMASTRVRFNEIERAMPVEMYEDSIVLIEKAAERLGITTTRLPSYAGHDAQSMHALGVPVSMIFVKNYGGSHNPQENINPKDAVVGTRLLVETIKMVDAS
ncbi:MAG: Zn-dependent hydrolase [Nanoarchaeota archaeon]|nr:MAG: Zn-dependent hydrolase [Nanoarchaeota archaeon]